ncbi:MAG: LytTR family DNA-binding domain-containing protein [Bacteroidota bacterium]
MQYHLLIVDDEAPAREKIEHFLLQLPYTFSMAFAKSGEEALQLLKSKSFDLLFLDIQMPRMDGFELLQALGPGNYPPVIFSTAYNQYALQAFEVHAVDYLLKPYDQERFSTATRRVLDSIDQKKYSHQAMLKMMEKWQPPTQKSKILWVNQSSKMIPLEVEHIEYLESDGNYVLIHTKDQHKYMLKQSLTELHHKLDTRQFIRVHRSYVVNKRSIHEMHPKSHGDLFAVLKSGRKIAVSRRYRDDLLS